VADNLIVKVALFGGAAAAVYYFFVMVPSGVPSTGVWNGYRNTGGGTRTSPAPGDTWVDANGAVVATLVSGTLQNSWQPATSTTSVTASTTTAAPATPAPSALDSLYTAMVAAATAAGISSTGPDGWNVYLVQAGYPSPAPDPADVFPGVDRSIAMTSAQYWAGMSAWLQKNKGMSGGIFGGLAGLIYCGGLC
jgi:hypothetical protein